jgi:hypothetical protein
MTEDERAQMFYEECMEQAGIENPPSLFEKDEDDLVRLHTELNNDGP